jgi:hypothetical protein
MLVEKRGCLKGGKIVIAKSAGLKQSVDNKYFVLLRRYAPRNDGNH